MEFKDWGKKALDFIDTPIEEAAFINILEGSVRSGKTVAMIPKYGLNKSGFFRLYKTYKNRGESF